MLLKAGIPKICFGMAMIGLSFTSNSKGSMYFLAAIFIFFGLVLVFENISKPIMLPMEEFDSYGKISK